MDTIFWLGLCVFVGGFAVILMAFQRRNSAFIWESGGDPMRPVPRKVFLRLIKVPNLDAFEMAGAIDLGSGEVVRGDVEEGSRIVYRLPDQPFGDIRLQDTTALPTFHNVAGAHMMSFKPADTALSARFQPSFVCFDANGGEPARYEVSVE